MYENEGFTVIMPTFNQCGFIRRSINSLLKQRFKNWELVIVNDGSTDDTEAFLSDYLSHPAIKYLKNDHNMGLGNVLNLGLRNASFCRITYLPSDDFFYEDHLQTLHNEFEKHPETVLMISGVKYDMMDSRHKLNNDQDNYAVSGHCLQLVQCAHRLTDDFWMERDELITADLFTMFWHKLAGKGVFSFTGKVTCHWMNHPDQRHKKIYERLGGGINCYRTYYGVKEPLKIKVSTKKVIDEKKQYAMFRNKTRHEKIMKVLLVGELAYNPERVYALEKHGCELYGLWIQPPFWGFNTIGHLPFGNVKDVPYENWKNAIQEIKPDIIYALTGTVAVPLAHEVLRNKGNIPMVSHFKEGPYDCIRKGDWAKLIELYSYSEGKIYINPEIKTWYETFMKDNDALTCILDNEMIPKEYFGDRFSPKLSAVDKAHHTVVVGRMIGIDSEEIKQLAENNIHIHLYTENYHDVRDSLITSMKKAAPSHFHVHSHCVPENWVKEFSRYDAGWLHCFKSANDGDIMQATWDDLNMPARMNTLAAAGLPMIQYDNTEHVVAMQEHLKKINGGLFYKNAKELSAQLSDRKLMKILSSNIRQNRFRFCFDEYVPELIDFFNQVITKTRKNEE